MNPNDPLVPDPLGTSEVMPRWQGLGWMLPVLQRSTLAGRMLRPRYPM